MSSLPSSAPPAPVRRCRPGSGLAPHVGVWLPVLLVLGSCSRREADPRAGRTGVAPPVPVLTTQVVARALPIQVSAVGNAEAYSTVAVRSRVTGELTEVVFREGQDVRHDQLLFTIDPRPARAALDQAIANLARDSAQAENARIELDRQSKLLESALISRDDFDKTEANWKALGAAVLADQAAVSNATLTLDYTRIRAPLDARTGDLRVHAGNLVQAGTDVLVTLNQIQPIYVTFAVPERYLGEIQRHMRVGPLAVEARVPGAETAERGELSFVQNAVDETTGTIQLKAVFTNAELRLWPGQFVDVSLRLKELTNAVVVPSQAVQRGQTNQYVFVVRPDQTVEMRSVAPGYAAGGVTAIDEGLQPGETVVMDGQLRLVPGSRVKVQGGLLSASGAPGGATSP